MDNSILLSYGFSTFRTFKPAVKLFILSVAEGGELVFCGVNYFSIFTNAPPMGLTPPLPTMIIAAYDP